MELKLLFNGCERFFKSIAGDILVFKVKGAMESVRSNHTLKIFD